MAVKCDDKVVDDITGFCGIVTARCEYPYSHVEVQVTSQELHDGQPVEAWFEEQRLCVISPAGTE